MTPQKKTNPLKDKNLIRVAKKLIDKLGLKILLVTLGELGMLICQPGKKAFHIPTLAREVFDVSGAGDTVIGTFTMAIEPAQILSRLQFSPITLLEWSLANLEQPQ